MPVDAVLLLLLSCLPQRKHAARQQTCWARVLPASRSLCQPEGVRLQMTTKQKNVIKRHIRYVKLQYYYTSANIIKKSVRERERENREKTEKHVHLLS